MAAQLSHRLHTGALAAETTSFSEAEVPLIRIVDSEVVNGQDTCQTGLLSGIARGLLQPSVSLSLQAAEKLQQHWPGKQHVQQHAGQLLKSLPVEILYDDTGLQLFDQITYLLEYYLTEAEASILDKSGTDIVRSCVQDGALLLELGAGSMRKTRLLLDAVDRVGCRDVTFAALDLCEESLREALSALQGCCSPDINLLGLVGTYDQGLQFIRDQQGPPVTLSQPTVVQQHFAAPVGDEDYSSDDELASGLGSASTPGPDCSNLAQVLLRDSSMGASSNRSSSSRSSELAINIVEPYSGDADHPAQARDSSSNDRTQQGYGALWAGPKVILWLGSSIGNCNREQAVKFLQQVRQKAMRAGDYLLIGIDRRNSSETVSAAYNDSQGITQQFILNGLNHCCRVLDSAHAILQAPSITLSHFEYFCLYNDALGRHEAYYQAKSDTTIRLPAPAAAAVSRQHADGTAAAESAGAAGNADCRGSVDVAIVAGELISVEFSYKYSHEEVQQLALGAGLVHVKAWSDAQQRYDLHLLQCRA